MRFAIRPPRGRSSYAGMPPKATCKKTPSPPWLDSTEGSSQDGRSWDGIITSTDDSDSEEQPQPAANDIRKVMPWRSRTVLQRQQASHVSDSEEEEDRTTSAPRNQPIVKAAGGVWRRPGWRKLEKLDDVAPNNKKGEEEVTRLVLSSFAQASLIFELTNMTNSPRIPESLDLTFLDLMPAPLASNPMTAPPTPVVPNDTEGHPSRWPGVPCRVPAFGSLSPADLREIRARAKASSSGIVPCGCIKREEVTYSCQMPEYLFHSSCGRRSGRTHGSLVSDTRSGEAFYDYYKLT